MQLTPLKMSNGTLVFTLSTGVRYLSPYNFGYYQVLKEPNLTEARLAELTEVPPLPEGIFKVHTNGDTLYVQNIRNIFTENHKLNNGTFMGISELPPNLQFLGVFTSIQEVIDYLPEYFI